MLYNFQNLCTLTSLWDTLSSKVLAVVVALGVEVEVVELVEVAMVDVEAVEGKGANLCPSLPPPVGITVPCGCQL